MKIYNKLVRDKIPQIMAENGATAVTRQLNDEEFLIELNKKLLEEVQEYLESGEIEELADIEEVILAILDMKDITREKLEDVRLTKALKRGAFKERIFLEREN